MLLKCSELSAEHTNSLPKEHNIRAVTCLISKLNLSRSAEIELKDPSLVGNVIISESVSPQSCWDKGISDLDCNLIMNKTHYLWYLESEPSALHLVARLPLASCQNKRNQQRHMRVKLWAVPEKAVKTHSLFILKYFLSKKCKQGGKTWRK